MLQRNLKTKGRQSVSEREKISWKKKEILNLRQSVGLIFQEADHQLIAGTVAEEVSFGPMNLKLSEQEVRNRVEKALAAMDLLKYQEKAPHELSGGEKKRVSIADILAMEPELMLLDEPASSLDPVNQSLLEANLEKLHQKGIALVVATHDVDFAWRWAKRILIFHQGRLVADGRGEEIFADEALIEKAALRSRFSTRWERSMEFRRCQRLLKNCFQMAKEYLPDLRKFLPAPSDGR